MRTRRRTRIATILPCASFRSILMSIPHCMRSPHANTISAIITWPSCKARAPCTGGSVQRTRWRNSRPSSASPHVRRLTRRWCRRCACAGLRPARRPAAQRQSVRRLASCQGGPGRGAHPRQPLLGWVARGWGERWGASCPTAALARGHRSGLTQGKVQAFLLPAPSARREQEDLRR